MQCAASIHLKYCCEVRNTEKRLSHLSSGWQEPPFICLSDVVGISVLISAGYLSGCFSAQPKVFPSIARTPSGLPPDRFLVLSKRRNGWPKAFLRSAQSLPKHCSYSFRTSSKSLPRSVQAQERVGLERFRTFSYSSNPDAQCIRVFCEEALSSIGFLLLHHLYHHGTWHLDALSCVGQ